MNIAQNELFPYGRIFLFLAWYLVLSSFHKTSNIKITVLWSQECCWFLNVNPRIKHLCNICTTKILLYANKTLEKDLFWNVQTEDKFIYRFCCLEKTTFHTGDRSVHIHSIGYHPCHQHEVCFLLSEKVKMKSKLNIIIEGTE